MDQMMLLDEARAAGLSVAIDGDKLVVRGPRLAEPVARRLLAHKSEVMAVLASARRPATEAANWRELFEERAAFRQYEAGYPRNAAECLAYGECLEKWCERHPMSLRPGVCAGCGKAPDTPWLDLDDGARVCFPHGAGQFGCLMVHGLRRKERAVAALTALGLTPPLGWKA
jgi:hypothetical protein